MSSPAIELFEREAARYDAWFDTARGKALFESEVLCLREVAADLERPWLEVGVGTGRFAKALGIDVGVDPARAALEYGAQRGIRVVPALGQALPFATGDFGAVFVIVTMCFAEDPEGLLREAARVAGRKGAVVLGIVPADSPWGVFYAALGRSGHAFYSRARFFRVDELEDIAQGAGLAFERCVSTLFQDPGDGPYEVETPRDGRHDHAGFVAALCRAWRPSVVSPESRTSDPVYEPDGTGHFR